MSKVELRVVPTFAAMVPDYEASEGGIVRFVGRKFDPAQCGFVMSDAPCCVPMRAEYIQELKAGALLPADAETAALAGVAFGSKVVSAKGAK